MGRIATTEAEVVKSIRSYLQARECEHPPVILWWERLASGAIHEGGIHVRLSRNGTSDFICVFVGQHKQIVVLFVECKAPSATPNPRKGAQADFAKKYHLRHVDMQYVIVQSVDDLKIKLNKLSYNFIEELQCP